MNHHIRRSIIIVPILLLMLLLPTWAQAVSLKQYREKIQRASRQLAALLYPEESLKTQTEIIFDRQARLKQIESEFFPIEKIELQGPDFEADNRSLLDNIQAIGKQPFDSPAQNKMIEVTMSKLLALELKLIQLENQQLSNRTKDEEKQKLAEILSRAEYQKPEVKRSYLRELLDDLIEWLRKFFPKPTTGAPSIGSFEGFSSVLQGILFVVVFSGIGFLGYKFGPFLLARFRNRERKETTSRVILGETLTANETSQILFSEAERLAREGNLRGAVRKGYIALLCELSDRKIIGLARNKTNRDYLHDVRNRESLFQNMTDLTGSFEKAWYGFGSPNQADWEEFRKQYQQTVRS